MNNIQERTMEKSKVSRFEYAVASQLDDPEYLATLEPYTEAEELQQRKDKIRSSLESLKPIKP